MNLIYTDAPLALGEHFETISHYADELKDAALQALDEEVVLVVAHSVYHAA